MYAATVSYRSLGKLGMTGRRVVVIPNAVRDLYIAIPAYIVLCEHPDKSPFIGMYAASVSYRSLGMLGMTERRIDVIPNAVRHLYIAISAYVALCELPPNPNLSRRLNGNAE